MTTITVVLLQLCVWPSCRYTYLYTPLGNRKLLLNGSNLAATSLPFAAHRQLLAVADSYCGTWNAVIAFGFLGFAAYAGSAVYAGLDLKAGLGIVVTKQWTGRGGADDAAD